jgi:3-oxoacyl-[acyl-carrier-protein] synthase II
MRRVVITGMGIVSPLGIGADSVWKKLINGESGIRTIEEFNTENLPVKVAGTIPVGSSVDNLYNGEEWVDHKELRRMGKFIAYAICASKQAMKDAGLDSNLTEEQKLNFGVDIGSGIGGLQEIYENSALLFQDHVRKISPFFIPSALINLPSGHVAIEYGLKGPNTSVVTACATGTHAIGDSYNMIKYGDADLMIAGGTESSVNALGVAGFSRMHALSTAFNDTPKKASRPWDKSRDGFVIAEGAGIVILEELEHAKKRGAKIYAEVVGYGMSGDANHITSPCADGNGAARCMERAIKKAGISVKDIGYVNAHGTSTPLGDMAELLALKKVFGDEIKNISISSTKSATGHLLGAAGAVEAIFTAMALKDGILPPTLNLDNPEEGTEGLDLVPHKAKKKELEYALSNSFGFGGTNASLILKKYK